MFFLHKKKVVAFKRTVSLCLESRVGLLKLLRFRLVARCFAALGFFGLSDFGFFAAGLFFSAFDLRLVKRWLLLYWPC